MPESEPSPYSGRAMDPVALQRLVLRLQAAPQAPWLHAEAARRMAQRLPLIKLKPAAVANWSSFLGASRTLLEEAYPAARQWALRHPLAPTTTPTTAPTTAPPTTPPTASHLAKVAPWWSPQRWGANKAAPAGVAADALVPRSVQLLWANMALHHEADIEATMKQWQRLLAVDGFLMFSTLGPGSLITLQRLYAMAGWPPPFAPFVDMHDLGDMLVHAGFADPVMDQELITLTWSNPQALLADLRAWGTNLHPRRRTGLCTPRWKRRLEDSLNQLAGTDGRLRLDFELVYGHAFNALPKARMGAETSVAVEDLRLMAKAARPKRN